MNVNIIEGKKFTVAKVNANSAMKEIDVELKITGLTLCRARMRIAVWLFKVASKIGGFNLIIEEQERIK